ncbi:MAG TPA: SPOR domain-containing protein [Saprospiraceae bacterium]|nr:SPOR domain-containing protein [Saprospiraceae bacterium]MCB9329392.1 SPOR domain-containing protein [Lewinellaceae bacterium]HPK08819.1 SPOR domain-containing protein [Saprospiraceae bacterium]HRX28819.1 SPOR domain-containing protein [Saprospiraceae bacterium]
MSRVLKILSVAIVLFFLYLWVSIFIKSCNKTKDDNIFDQVENTSPEETEYVDTDTTYVEEEVIEDKTSEDGESVIDYNELDKTIDDAMNNSPDNSTTTSSSTTTATESNNHSTASSSSGKYMVICGSFLVKENAEKMKRKLNKLGYNNAETIVFDLSQYHSVSAARYNDYNQAAQAVDVLKRKGIDAYVHTRK